jgi:hypothetical protein
MKRNIILALLALMVIGGYVASVVYATDPCQGTTAAVQVIAVSPTATAGTYQLVGPQTIGGNNRRIAVCGYDFTATGTTPTFKFEEGPSPACSPSPVALSGVYAPTSGTQVHGGEAGQSVVLVDPGDGLCVVTGGTTPALNGVLQYVVLP